MGWLDIKKPTVSKASFAGFLPPKTPSQVLDDKIDDMLVVEPLKNFKLTQVKEFNGKKYYFVDGFIDEDVSEDGDEIWDMYKIIRGTMDEGGDAKFIRYISNTGGERYAVYVYYKDPKAMKEVINGSNSLWKTVGKSSRIIRRKIKKTVKRG